MTDLLEIGAGLIRLRDASGAVKFDSNEKLFQATEKIVDTVTVGGWTASFNGGTGIATDVNTDVEHVLATINAHNDTVVGAFEVTAVGGKGVTGLGWFNAGGTYMHFHDGAVPASRGVCQEMATFTFRARSSQLVLHERVILRAIVGIGVPTNSITLGAVTFDYQLYVGSFV